MRIRYLLLISFVLLAGIPLGGLGFYTMTSVEEVLTEEVLANLESVASIQKTRVEEVVESNQRLAAILASRTGLRHDLANYTQHPTAWTLARVGESLRDARAASPQLTNLHVVSPQGFVIVSTDPDALGANVSHTDAFLLGQHGYRGDLLRVRNDTQIVFDLVGPLQLNGRFLGVLVAESSAHTLLATVQDYTGLGQTGETLLARREADGTPTYIVPLRFGEAPRPIEREDNPVLAAIDGQEQTFRQGTDYRGMDVLAASRHIRSADWGLVVKVDRDEAFAPLANLQQGLLAGTLVGLAIVAGGSLIVSAYLSRPIENVEQTAREVASGQLDRRVPERGAAELVALTQSFNKMAAALQDTMNSLEVRVAHRTQALEVSNSRLQQFAYVASHDLRAPLRHISGFTNLLREHEDRLDPEAKECLAKIQNGVDRMNALIGSLLQYSRATAETRAFETVNLAGLCDDLFETLRPQADEVGATLTRGDLPYSVGDPVQIRQALQNLLQNSIKFSRPDVPVSVHVSADVEDDRVILHVKDNGIGIDPKHHEQVFQMFQRLHPRGQFEGTGIGLAVVQGIAERHGGRVWVDSTFGKGATFHLSLPATPRMMRVTA